MSTRLPPDLPPLGPTAPDVNALAEQFLDLWQGQISAWASDPATTESMARLGALWGLTPPPTSAPPFSASGSVHGAAPPAASQPTAAPLGAAPAAAASPELLELLLKLSTRLAVVEQRLADLEGGDANAPNQRGERV